MDCTIVYENILVKYNISSVDWFLMHANQVDLAPISMHVFHVVMVT